ncbi:MAG: hypothetical protein ISN28_10290 [Ectothiorhodospiraceae bacterium AqS1]|nr:hypothetical protein [Ectothiorhodospiraceae bacterium AqS1]
MSKVRTWVVFAVAAAFAMVSGIAFSAESSGNAPPPPPPVFEPTLASSQGNGSAGGIPGMSGGLQKADATDSIQSPAADPCTGDAYACFYLANNDQTAVREPTQVSFIPYIAWMIYTAVK